MDDSSEELKQCMADIAKRLEKSKKLEEVVAEVLLESQIYLEGSKIEKSDSFEEVNDNYSHASTSILIADERLDIENNMDPCPFSEEFNSCVSNYDTKSSLLKEDQTLPSNEVSFKTKSFQKDGLEKKNTNLKRTNKNNEYNENLAFKKLKEENKIYKKRIHQLEKEKKINIKKIKKLKEEIGVKNTLQIKLEQELALLKQQKLNENKEISDEELVKIEFTCPICTELIIKATVLNCSHTFCESCIFTWKRKTPECPICREFIFTESNSLIVDTFIDMFIQKRSQEEKERRTQLIQERLDKEIHSEKEKFQGSPRTAFLLRSAEALLNEEIDADSPDDFDEIVPGTGYYGGYGRCYNCGNRGHWANGCPEA